MIQVKDIFEEIIDVSESLDDDFSIDVRCLINAYIKEESADFDESINTLRKNFNNYEEMEKTFLTKWFTELQDFSFSKEGLYTGINHYSMEELEYSNLISLNDSKDTILGLDRDVSGRFIVPSSIKQIGRRAFGNCHISEVVFHDDIRVIPNNCFKCCYNLNKVKFGKNLKAIAEEAFACSGIKEIYIPEGTVAIGEAAFSTCEHLVKGRLPSTIKSIETAVFYNTGFNSVGTLTPEMDENYHLEIPETLSYIGDKAFNHSIALTLVNLPKLEVININSFYLCPLDKENCFINNDCVCI